MNKVASIILVSGFICAVSDMQAVQWNFRLPEIRIHEISKQEGSNQLMNLGIQNKSDGKVEVTVQAPGSIQTSGMNPGNANQFTVNCPAHVRIKKLSGTGRGNELSLDLKCKDSELHIVTDEKAKEGFKAEIKEIEPETQEPTSKQLK